ncbi:MAG: NAD(P)H-dependent glycerol-3-phosphate dehydrogenase, partial [Elusimicrobiota bacterium]
MAEKKDRYNIAVLGAGSWGITLAKLLYEKGHKVNLWEYSLSQSRKLDKERRFPPLGNYIIPRGIKITSSLGQSLNSSDYALLVVPSKALRSTCLEMQKLKKVLPPVIISAVKGFDYESLKSPTQMLRAHLGKRVHLSVLSGPSHAEEVIKKVPTAVVSASSNIETAAEVQKLFSNDYFRVYTSSDVRGVELGGALKNVIAIASGVTRGLGLGDNTRAALITRGNNEIKSIGIKMGARQVTFNGLSGIGDLIVTCFSEHSRNYRFGKYLGEGKSFEQAKKKVSATVEGADTVKSCIKLSSIYRVPMPLCKAVYEILYKGKDPAVASRELMT